MSITVTASAAEPMVAHFALIHRIGPAPGVTTCRQSRRVTAITCRFG
ncbi:MAG: hypothetical protein FWJ62_07450 [Thermaerobacter sp.]